MERQGTPAGVDTALGDAKRIRPGTWTLTIRGQAIPDVALTDLNASFLNPAASLNCAYRARIRRFWTTRPRRGSSPRKTFSMTLRPGTSASSWEISVMPRRSAACGVGAVCG